MAIKDTTLQSWQPPSPQAEGADIKALLKNEQVVMIEEERVDADTATLHRYFFKNNRLILASSLQMNACIDTSQMCVTEMRCYFDEDKMICEYSRSLSLPVNASGELDPSKLENYLHDQAYDTTSPNPTKGRQLLKESEILRERILQQSTPQG